MRCLYGGMRGQLVIGCVESVICDAHMVCCEDSLWLDEWTVGRWMCV